MDKTELVERVKHLFELSGHKVETSVVINHTEIDVVAEELHGLVRKTILIECTEEKRVGVPKMRKDAEKLRAAMNQLGTASVPMHVALRTYTSQARGYARSNNIDSYTLQELEARLVNFDEYIKAVETDPIREVILGEYQQTRLHFEGNREDKLPAFQFFDEWLKRDERWLTVLGDYGVGKSWMLRRLLYRLLDIFKESPSDSMLPFFVPLQKFTKAFDLDTLFLATFSGYGLSGVHLDAFKYLVNSGRILFLYDSFDEMAQSLSRSVLRENLEQLLLAVQGPSKAIMTSRPTYFESRAERLMVSQPTQDSSVHRHDQIVSKRQAAMSRFIEEHVTTTQFARLNDLSADQRKRLFGIVLRGNSEAKIALEGLFSRFGELESISQRAVMARLLTTVAETLASNAQATTPDGYPLLPVICFSGK
ncbi:MAG: NACHT domain-containing protein [Planctomycetota bacterium]